MYQMPDVPDENRVIQLRVPLCTRRAFVVGCGDGTLGRLIKERTGGEVYGIEDSAFLPGQAEQHMDGVVRGAPLLDPLPFPNGFFDAIVIPHPLRFGEQLPALTAKLAPLLAPLGQLFLPADGDLDPEHPAAPSGMAEMLRAAGLASYMMWPWDELTASAGVSDGYQNPHARWLCQALWPTYDPIQHARQVFDAGHPDWAYELLCAVPAQYRANPEVQAFLHAERQMCLMAMDKPGGPYPQLRLFNGALMLFYDAVDLVPTFHESYQCQAEFWRRIGDDDMARRILRSIHEAAPNPAVAQQLERYTRPSPRRPETAPEWSGAWRPRILFVQLETRLHYGLDVFYDGLCRLLGKDHVVEWPYKPTLHGVQPQRHGYYPCVLDWPGEPQSVDDIVAALEHGAFDLVLCGTIDQRHTQAEYEALRRVVDASRGLPFFLMDAQDDCVDNRQDMAELTGRGAIHGYFKRELLACARFGPNVFPFPFSYADGRVRQDIANPRSRALFWAGQRVFGMRRLYLQHIEAMLGERFDASYSQEEYVQALDGARIAVNLFGAGFDCVRYWEVPARGAMLFSERPPIRIPNDFEDGVSAVFFDDLEDMTGKLSHYLAHPEQAAAIAQAGHAHLKAHHTGTARARHVLGYIESALRLG